jgi:SAM-dependent methyltransferase
VTEPKPAAAQKFVCNVCGVECLRTPGPIGRETASCLNCLSTVRLRGLAALLSRELFGADLTLPDFPRLKSLRGLGMSDPPALASRLAEKFDYINTFYHQPPQLDITQIAEADAGRYDFVISSEVMEHVPGPVEHAFANLHHLLKPEGFLLLTVPYRLGGGIDEHFPALHEYTLASPGGRTVLINRRRDGAVEVFEDLCFHGGHGSTLELRVFSEEALRQVLACAGFSQVRIAAENVPEFGVEHAETWSLPVIARKGRSTPPAPELALAYRDAVRRAGVLERELNALRAEYDRFIEHHQTSHAEWERQSTERVEWVRKVERDFEERTEWARSLEKEKDQALTEVRRAQASEAEAWQRAAALERELGEVRSALTQLQMRLWTRIGRKARLL